MFSVAPAGRPVRQETKAIRADLVCAQSTVARQPAEASHNATSFSRWIAHISGVDVLPQRWRLGATHLKAISHSNLE
jgi:hypothetical protein